MSMENTYLFDGSTAQWNRIGHAERRLLDETGLTVMMHHDMFRQCVVLTVHEPRKFGGECLIEKSFSRWSIDSASDWLAKLTADYSSWK